MKPCSNPLCTNRVDDDDRFCGICGTYVGPDITQVGNQCVNCGRTLQPGQTFCSNCGSFTTLVKPQPAVSIDSQANIPTQSVTRILPPLKVATIKGTVAKEELEVVWRTSKNVYAPYMRKLIHFDVPDFSVGFTGRSTGWLKQDLEVTDFTYQAELNQLLGELSFVFRFNSQTGDGYRFGKRKEPYSSSPTTLVVEMFHAHSKLTGEPLQEPNVSQTLLSYKPSDRGTGFHIIALVAQKGTLDIYVDLVHLGRVENATLLQGKLGFYLPEYNIRLVGGKWFDRKEVQDLFHLAKVWIP